jgi:hypothetical protein
MMSRLFLASLLLVASVFAAASPAQAQSAVRFTPESGWWWNPAEEGYGFSIEIQDDFIFLVAFAYADDGFPTWYAAQGTMADKTSFEAPLYQRENGTCLGCDYSPPGPAFGAGGATIRIQFTSETTATVTWAGRTIQVQRQDYYLSRNPTVTPKTELWLGEWQFVMDWSALGGEYENYPYVGEILFMDLLDTAPTTDQVLGCRLEFSTDAFCSDFAIDNHDAAVFYSQADGTNIIFVRENPTAFLVFEGEVGTYQFDGYAKRCPDNLDDYYADCLDNDDDYPYLPVRGWRSASRAYVQGDDDAPAATITPKMQSTATGFRAQPVVPQVSTKAVAPRKRVVSAGSDAAMRAVAERMKAGSSRTR